MFIDPIQPILDHQGFVVIDGALATELERRGANLNDPLWSAKVLLEAPGLIEEVHYDYFLAGADVAITATYQATFDGFAQRGIDRAHAKDLMQQSVQLAASARNRARQTLIERGNQRPLLVAASVGPYGAYLADGSEYRGDYGLSVEALMDFHRPRMALLAECVTDGHADLLACETIPSLTEAQALIRLLAEFPGVPAWLSFSCCDGEHVCHGERFTDCVAMASMVEQIVAVGINCTAPRFVTGLLDSLKCPQEKSPERSQKKPLLVYPNSGEGWDAAAKRWVANSDINNFGEAAKEWYAAEARLLGGCCRSTPDDIQEIRSALSLLIDNQ